jgi:hypothetical protein
MSPSSRGVHWPPVGPRRYLQAVFDIVNASPNRPPPPPPFRHSSIWRMSAVRHRPQPGVCHALPAVGPVSASSRARYHHRSLFAALMAGCPARCHRSTLMPMRLCAFAPFAPFAPCAFYYPVPSAPHSRSTPRPRSSTALAYSSAGRPGQALSFARPTGHPADILPCRPSWRADARRPWPPAAIAIAPTAPAVLRMPASPASASTT